MGIDFAKGRLRNFGTGKKIKGKKKEREENVRIVHVYGLRKEGERYFGTGRKWEGKTAKKRERKIEEWGKGIDFERGERNVGGNKMGRKKITKKRKK